MLVVDAEKRYTVDQCLSHPWMTAGAPSVNDSTDGLVGGIKHLEMNRRVPHRERTLLSSLNTVEVTKMPGGPNHDQVKVFNKNGNIVKEQRPADNRAPEDFVELGGKGDASLFGNETSIYSKKDIATAKAGNHKKTKGGR